MPGLKRDKTRPSRVPPLPREVRLKVIAKTVQETPPNATHWSRTTMADAVGISPSIVGRIWADAGLKPHLTKGFKVSNDPMFEEKVTEIVGLYLDPPDRAVVLCVDEKSQIQALDRTQPGLPLKKGRAATMTHDYKRHGTTTLFAALDVKSGLVIGDCMPRHRAKEFLNFLRRIDRAGYCTLRSGNSLWVGAMSPCRGMPQQGLSILVFHGVAIQPWRSANGQAEGSRYCLDAVEAVLEQLIEHGPDEIASVFAWAFELAMQIERERFLGAGLYERTPGSQGYANGYKAKRIDMPAGSVTVQVPKTAGHDGEPCLTAVTRARAPLGSRRHAGGGRDVHQGRLDPASRDRSGRARRQRSRHRAEAGHMAR